MSAAYLFSAITPESIEAFFKGTGILGAIGLMIYLGIKYKVVRLVSVDQASEWIRTKWGVAQYHRFGARKGRLVRLKAGRHLLIRGIYDGWEICLREIPLVVSSLSQSYRGRMLLFDRITVGYRVIAKDDAKGDTMMLRSFLSVRNLDRDNQKSESLDDRVEGIVIAGLGTHLRDADSDEYGLPLLSEAAWVELVEKKLRKRHGVRITSIDWSAPTWMTGQQQYDAGRLIAQALTNGARIDASSQEGGAEVIELPTQPHTA